MIARDSRPELAALWADKYRFELWLEVELTPVEALPDTPRGGGGFGHTGVR